MLSCQSSTLRVLVVDDHELTRFSLKLALQSQANIELVGMACNGQEAIEMVKRHAPNVIVLDLKMPVMDGWSAANHIKKIAPETQILAYSSAVEDPQLEAETRAAKIDAFCNKGTATQEIVALVKQLGQRATQG